MNEHDIEKLSNYFPMNTSYIKGECYLNWSYATDSCTSNFIVECESVDSALIISANASTNKLVLVDNTVLENMQFTIRPTFPDRSLKLYGIGSSKTKTGINVTIINYQDEEPENETNDT